MKYIRTKDGRILSLNEFKYEKKYHWYRPNEKYLSRANIGFTCWRWCFEDEYDLIPEVLGKIMVEKIKREECEQADTIEELCDEFVVEYRDKTYDLMQKLKWAEMEEYNASLVNNGGIIYGAIWTSKGLIYVAKMNDEGELCLL